MDDGKIKEGYVDFLEHVNIKEEEELGVLKDIKGRTVDVVYTAFTKAFDKVPYGRLVQKIKPYGIHGLRKMSGTLQGSFGLTGFVWVHNGPLKMAYGQGMPIFWRIS
eukprot:g47394.t1